MYFRWTAVVERQGFAVALLCVQVGGIYWRKVSMDVWMIWKCLATVSLSYLGSVLTWPSGLLSYYVACFVGIIWQWQRKPKVVGFKSLIDGRTVFPCSSFLSMLAESLNILLLNNCNLTYNEILSHILHKCKLIHTHTHTCLTALFPGLPRWAGTRKAKPIWILLKQETVSGSGIN